MSKTSQKTSLPIEPNITSTELDSTANFFNLNQDFETSNYESQFESGYRGLSVWVENPYIETNQDYPDLSQQKTKVGFIPGFLKQIPQGFREDIFWKYHDLQEKIDFLIDNDEVSKEEKSKRIQDYKTKIQNLKQNIEIYKELDFPEIEEKLSEKRQKIEDEVLSSHLKSYEIPLDKKIAAESLRDYKQTNHYKKTLQDKFKDSITSDQELYSKIKDLNEKYGLNTDDIPEAKILLYQNILCDIKPENLLDSVLTEVYQSKGISDSPGLAHDVSQGQRFDWHGTPGEAVPNTPELDCPGGSSPWKKIVALGAAATFIGAGIAALGQHFENDSSHFFKTPGHLPILLLATKHGSFNDLDLDGVPNSWEEEHGLNKWNHRDAKLDLDHDGYSNLKEYHIGTNPFDPDVDNDGLIDGQDPDNDGMSSWFERNIADLDPLTPNDRYVLIMNSVQKNQDLSIENLLNSLKDLGFDEQYKFFNKSMSIPEENIIELGNSKLTYLNFLDACEKISEKSDENDLLYVAINGHGGVLKTGLHDYGYLSLEKKGNSSRSYLYYDELFKNLDKIPSKAQYVQINTCHSGTALDIPNSNSVPRVILTSCESDEKIDGPIFTKVFYDTGLSKNSVKRVAPLSSWNIPDLLKYSSIPIPTKTSPDKNKNHFVSIDEIYNEICGFIPVSHPQLSDPHNISDNFYFGEYWVRD